MSSCEEERGEASRRDEYITGHRSSKAAPMYHLTFIFDMFVVVVVVDTVVVAVAVYFV